MTPSPVISDEYWMNRAARAATWSRDRSRQTGAVLVHPTSGLVSVGWNCFPRGADATIEARHLRPAKYQWTEHAERNAIYRAAKKGRSTRGCSLYQLWYPCADCARAIIQSGIVTLYAVVPDWNDAKYGTDFVMVRTMLAEAGIMVRWMPGVAPVAKPCDQLVAS